ncbi:hypothetical protein MSPP1_001617 [Malassezia sp. CBS 17886]|nr:hypothetical protein MSPP1_001617 [Malassezia sp. CBS 17886]
MPGRLRELYLYTPAAATAPSPTESGELVEQLRECVAGAAQHSVLPNGIAPENGTPAARSARWDPTHARLDVPPIDEVQSADAPSCPVTLGTHTTLKMFVSADAGASCDAVDFDDAVARTLQITRSGSVDTLMLAFPELSRALDREAKVPGEHTTRMLRHVWNRAGSARVGAVGIADLAFPALDTVFSAVRPDARGTSDELCVFADPAVVSSAHTRVCAPHTALVEWCRAHSARLIVQRDRIDMLSPAVLADLVAALPHAPDAPLDTRWIAKYTVLVPDRGVVTHEGYIVHARCRAADGNGTA